MRTPRQVMLDAQFGRDIEWLRYEFKPSAMGTRDEVAVPITVVAPGNIEVTLLIYALDLYIVGWQNAHGTYHLKPDANQTFVNDPARTVKFTGHYSDLEVFLTSTPIRKYAVYDAVRRLSEAQNVAAASRLFVPIGLMAITISEALRQDVVAGLMENLFADRIADGGLQRSLVEHYAKNYSKHFRAGDPYVELPKL